MVKTKTSEERPPVEEADASLWARFFGDLAAEIATMSILGGVLFIVGAGVTALLLRGAPSYSEAGGATKAAVWVIWLAILGSTTAYKWRLMRTSAEAKGYRWEDLTRSMMRQYAPVAGSAALLAVAMTVVICRLDHAEYLLGLWLMAWGCAAVAMGVNWGLRSVTAIGAVLLALGFFQVLLWPSYVLTTVGVLGLFWLVVGVYFWYAY